MARSSVVVLISLAPAASACAREESVTSTIVHRDSAGVAIVESTVPTWGVGEGWAVDTLPMLDLAEVGDDPNHEFFRATDATRLSDESLVVVDDGFDEIRVFSPDGAHVRTIGRSGEGPGEFSRLDQVMALPGDSILAYDYWLARLTVFTRDGDMSRLITLDGAYRPRPLFRLESGGFVGESTDFTGFGEETGLHRSPSPIVRVGDDGGVTDTLTTIPGYESVNFSRGDAMALWGKNAHLAVYLDRVYLGWADSLEFRVHAPDGTLERIVRVPGYDLTLTDAEIEAEDQAFVPDRSDMDAITREIVEAQPNRTHRPAYSEMVVDFLGNVWLEKYQGLHELGDPKSWEIFDRSGGWLGSVMLPPRFRVFRIGPDWILGRRPDELDIQHIQLLSLSRD